MKAEFFEGLIACQNYPIVYQNLPKAGCTSIKCQLHKLDTGHYPENPIFIHRRIRRGEALVSFQDMDQLHQRLLDRKILFTFVRHPLNRAYSCFMEKIFFVHEFSFPNIRKYIEQEFGASFPEANDLARNSSVDGYSTDLHRENFRSFLEFVKQNLAGNTSVRRDSHWRIQSKMLSNVRHGYKPDYIGKVERFKQDFEAVLSIAGVQEKLDFERRFNETPDYKVRLEDIVDSGLKELSLEIYERDYLEYNFS